MTGPDQAAAYKPVVLVCRSVGERHELWGLTAKGDARFFALIGTVARPQAFRNRVVAADCGVH